LRGCRGWLLNGVAGKTNKNKHKKIGNPVQENLKKLAKEQPAKTKEKKKC
jgi:hypothetical protein